MSRSSSRQSRLLLQAKEDREYEQLLAEHKVLLLRMAQNRYRRNSGALVSQLAPELLTEIFLIVREEALSDSHNRSNFGWTRGCTDVCVRWRDAALSASILWSKVFANTRDQPESEQQISTILSRRANADFTLHCTRSKSRLFPDPALILLSKYTQLLSALDWQGQTKDLCTLFQDSDPHPNGPAVVLANKLQKLTFRSGSGDFRDLLYILKSAPFLRELHWILSGMLNFSYLPTEVLRFPSIKRLLLERRSDWVQELPNVVHVKPFLQFFPNVEYLFIEGSYLDGWEHFLGQTSASQLIFKNLTTICVGNRSFQSVSNFLSYINLPRLKSVEIRRFHPSELDSLLSLCFSKLSGCITLSAQGTLDSLWSLKIEIEKPVVVAMVRIEGSLDQLKRLELRGSIFTDLTAFMPATSVTTLVLHDISSGVLFSMLSKDSSSTIIFPSLQTLCLRGAATTFASVFGPDFTTALAGRAFHQTPVHRLIIEEPMDAGVGFHMLLHLQHIQELVLNGILYLVDEGKAETEAEFTDSGSDSDEDNNEWEDFWEYEGEEPLWQKVCDHISEDEDM